MKVFRLAFSIHVENMLILRLRPMGRTFIILVDAVSKHCALSNVLKTIIPRDPGTAFTIWSFL